MKLDAIKKTPCSKFMFKHEVPSISVFLKLGVATHLCVAKILLCVSKNTVSYLSRKSESDQIFKDQINTF